MKKVSFVVKMEDCRVDTFTCGGRGGSGKDTSNNGVRIVHQPSGAVGECREERHQYTNKKRAWERLANSPKFRMWARQIAAELRSGRTVDEEVEAMMHPNNLKIEQRNENGVWVEVKA